MTDLEDCARYLALLAAQKDKECPSKGAIDEYVQRGGSKQALRRAFDKLAPPETPVTDFIRAELDN